jgi:hypothetical protein
MAQQVSVKFVDDLDGSDAAGTPAFRRCWGSWGMVSGEHAGPGRAG